MMSKWVALACVDFDVLGGCSGKLQDVGDVYTGDGSAQAGTTNASAGDDGNSSGAPGVGGPFNCRHDERERWNQRGRREQ